jgi:hypothetical protein
VSALSQVLSTGAPLGLDHTRLTYKFQGRDYRLTDVSDEVVHSFLS